MPQYKMIEPVKYDRKKHNISFKNAFNGIILAYKTQPNFRFHVLFFSMVIVASYLYRVSLHEFLALMVVSAIVFAMEMVNTAVEALGDEISNGEFKKLIGVAKDVAAGGVLLSVLFAIGIGLIIFLPRLFVLAGIPLLLN